MIAIGRIPAICITIILELVVGVVISRCQHIMRAHILMASFLPLLSSIAGNVGILSSTNTMRVLAVGARVTSVVRKEFICAIFLSLVGGVMLFCVAFIWSNSGAFALATSLAVALNCTLAGLIGTVGPLTFRRLGLDYGFMAGPFETAFQDLLGTTIYFSLMLLLG
jgi:magnesium transporter